MTTKKNPGLGARMSTVAAALAASENPEPTAPASRDKPVALSLRIPPPIHEELRRLAYETRTPIHTMIMEGIGMYLRTKGGET
jgi:hypothetical protein